MLNSLFTALRTLTILPIPGQDAKQLARAMPYFPVAGFVVGFPVFCSALLLGEIRAWPFGGAVIGLALMTVLTGGLHIDGLADTCDALGGRTRERRLEIMKDVHAGSFGVAAVVLGLMLKAAAIATLAEYQASHWCILPMIVSRAMQVWLAVRLPYARAEGGTGRAFVEGATRGHALAALGAAAVLCVIIGQITGLAVLAASLVPTLLMMPWMRRKFGGVTGDLLGFANEVIECFAFSLLAVLAGGAAW